MGVCTPSIASSLTRVRKLRRAVVVDATDGRRLTDSLPPSTTTTDATLRGRPQTGFNQSSQLCRIYDSTNLINPVDCTELCLLHPGGR